jgi:hypothetical protein
MLSRSWPADGYRVVRHGEIAHSDSQPVPLTTNWVTPGARALSILDEIEIIELYLGIATETATLVKCTSVIVN